MEVTLWVLYISTEIYVSAVGQKENEIWRLVLYKILCGTHLNILEESLDYSVAKNLLMLL